MNYDIKRLQAADLNILKKLLALFSIVFEGHTFAEKDIPSDEYLTELLERTDFYAFVAYKEQEVLGGLTGYEFNLATSNKKEIYLYDLAVDENSRLQGIASALVATLKVSAKENNVSVIFVEAESEDKGAVTFYQSLGIGPLSVQHFNITVD